MLEALLEGVVVHLGVRPAARPAHVAFVVAEGGAGMSPEALPALVKRVSELAARWFGGTDQARVQVDVSASRLGRFDDVPGLVLADFAGWVFGPRAHQAIELGPSDAVQWSTARYRGLNAALSERLITFGARETRESLHDRLNGRVDRAEALARLDALRRDRPLVPGLLPAAIEQTRALVERLP